MMLPFFENMVQGIEQAVDILLTPFDRALALLAALAPLFAAFSTDAVARPDPTAAP